MPLIPMRILLDCAAKYHFAVAAFNINNLEQIQAIMEAAYETNSPVLLQVSRGALKYAGEQFLIHLVLAAEKSYPEIPIVLHLDHGDSLESCRKAISLGFTSVMIDGSIDHVTKSPNTYEVNRDLTRSVVEYAKKYNVSVEGELACLGSLQQDRINKEHLSTEDFLTDPDEAVRFVAETNVDALAIAIGTSHGAYKFKKKPDDTVLDTDRIAAIHEKIPHCHLVMHGSSSVPQDLLKQINEYGGTIPVTYGVPIAEIQKGIHFGVRKVNVDTDLRLAMTAAVRKYFFEKEEGFDPRTYLGKGREAMKKICMERMLAFGQANKLKYVVSFLQEHQSQNAQTPEQGTEQTE